jgi:WD40 repeat protein
MPGRAALDRAAELAARGRASHDPRMRATRPLHALSLACAPLLACADTGDPGEELGCMVELFALDGPRSYLYSADWAPNDEYVLGGANREIRLYAADTEAEELRLVETMLDEASSRSTPRQALFREEELAWDEEQESAVTWALAGKPLITGTWGDRNMVQTWTVDREANTLELDSEFAIHQSGMDVLEWSRDGKRIVTGGHYDTIRLSVFEDGGLTTVAEHPDDGLGIHAASWSPDEDYMVLAAANIDRIALLDARGCPADR